MNRSFKIVAAGLLASTTLSFPASAYLTQGWDANKTVNLSRSVTAAPTTGSENSVTTACTGNMAGTVLATCFQITGSATLGQPTSGYLYTPGAYPFYTFLYSSSGWNNSTTDNTGRTGAAAYRTHLYQHGQGDVVAYNCAGFVDSTKASSTSYLANPAIVCMNGDFTAGVDGAYMQGHEYIFGDAGTYDISVLGDNIRVNRTVTTGAKNAWWGGFRFQSEGSGAADIAYGGTGKVNYGFDCSNFTLSAAAACLTLKADQRIYFNTTADTSGIGRFPSATPNTYLMYSSGASAFQFFVANGLSLQIANSLITSNTDHVFKHQRSGGSAPALTSCGGGSPAISGGDYAGTVTMGTTATGCVITFNVAYTSAPTCVVSWRSNLATMQYTVSTTALTLTQTSTSGNLVDYTCVGKVGG